MGGGKTRVGGKLKEGKTVVENRSSVIFLTFLSNNALH